jgi:hypothetical protein
MYTVCLPALVVWWAATVHRELQCKYVCVRVRVCVCLPREIQIPEDVEFWDFPIIGSTMC